MGVLVGDRYLDRLRVKAWILDRHAKKHLWEGAWGDFECPGVAVVLRVLEFLVLFLKVM